jgi:hypothetical protein
MGLKFLNRVINKINYFEIIRFVAYLGIFTLFFSVKIAKLARDKNRIINRNSRIARIMLVDCCTAVVDCSDQRCVSIQDTVVSTEFSIIF